MTGQDYNIDFRGRAGNSKEAVMTLNARVQMSPEKLNDMIQKEIVHQYNDNITGTIKTHHYLSPGRPNPTYRYKHVV